MKLPRNSASLIVGNFLFLLVSLGAVAPSRPAKRDGSASDLIAATRCRARCLANLDEYLRRLDSSGIREYDPSKSNVLKACLMDRTCAACSRPCDLISRLDQVECSEWCQEDEDDCLATCAFLTEIGPAVSNPGHCPAPGARSTSAVCINACERDRDCDADDGDESLKCCPNGCGTSCQKPVGVDLGAYPPKPRNVKVIGKKKKGSRSAVVKWSVPRRLDFAENPTVYIVQCKHHAGQSFNRHLLPKDWESPLLVVNGAEATVKEMELGHWYTFRVAAVDVRGGAGFVEAASPFRLQTEPKAPSAPSNLTAVSSMVKSGKHFVKIRWDAPSDADVPISKYKIFWNKQIKGQSVLRRKQKDGKKTISGKNSEFVLKNLEGSSVYLVQVQAVIQFGGRKLRSKKTHVVISTHGDEARVSAPQRLQAEAPVSPRPSPQPRVVDPARILNDPKRPHSDAARPRLDPSGQRLIDAVIDLALDSPIPALVENLTAGVPYFQNGLVRVDLAWNSPRDKGATRQMMIHWSPDVCIGGSLDSLMTKPVTTTTSDNRFTVFDLRFDCRYNIQVQGVSSSGKRGPISRVTVNVLGCKDTLVRGRIEPQCGLETNALSSHLPQRPEALAYEYRVTRNDVVVKLSWDFPKGWPAKSLTGWNLLWGKRRRRTEGGFYSPFSPHPLLDKETAVRRRLPPNVTSVEIPHLETGADFVFRVAALSSRGEGRVAEILLTTPLLPQPKRSAPRNPPAPTTPSAARESSDEAIDGLNGVVSVVSGDLLIKPKMVDEGVDAKNDDEVERPLFVLDLEPKKLKMAEAKTNEATSDPNSSSSLFLSPSLKFFIFVLVWRLK